MLCNHIVFRPSLFLHNNNYALISVVPTEVLFLRHIQNALELHHYSEHFMRCIICVCPMIYFNHGGIIKSPSL